MQELTELETLQVSGGLGPLTPVAVIGIDLALNAVLIGYAAYAAGLFYRMPPKHR